MIEFNIAEISKISLNPGDVLVVKLMGDEYADFDLHSLKAALDSVFPNNKVLVTTIPSEHDMKIEIISSPAASSCAVSVCSDCSCGKAANGTS
jgi:hypothetical protein